MKIEYKLYNGRKSRKIVERERACGSSTFKKESTEQAKKIYVQSFLGNAVAQTPNECR